MSAGPTWSKVAKVFDATAGQYASFYSPCILDSALVPLSPSFGARYVMYYSTDHDPGAGGVAVAIAPTPVGPWTNYGEVYVDPEPGFSTETPWVWWDGSIFRMFYQQAGIGASQATLQATSINGLNWTELPPEHGISVTPGQWPGDGHTGYARVFPGAGLGQWVAYHLAGGGDGPHFGRSESEDGGSTWRTDPRPLLYAYDQVAAVAPGWRQEWNSGNLWTWQGVRWWTGLLSEFGSGGGAVMRKLAQAPITADGRHIAGTPRLVFPLDPAANLRSLFILADRWLYYQIDDELFLAELE
jgi:hypothetical protein